MRKVLFSLFSPAGNTTLLLRSFPATAAERAFFCGRGMEIILAEQAAFADVAEGLLTMAGGEFCVNAARSFGALLDKQAGGSGGTTRRYAARVSGWQGDIELEAKGAQPHWVIGAKLALPPCPLMENAQGMQCAHLPGISHYLIQSAQFPAAAQAAEEARRLLQLHGTGQAAATGVVWWRKKGEKLAIWPYVMVPGAGTAMLESSCGSGSLALALALHAQNGRQNCALLQPGGDVLDIELDRDGKEALISGGVDFLAGGDLWLPDCPRHQEACP